MRRLCNGRHMIINAIITNAVTNALHASFLLLYFIGAIVHYLKKDNTFSLLMVLFFLTLLILKILGVYVHYQPATTEISSAWIAISLLIIMLNYLIVQAIKIPDASRAFVVFLSILFSFLFIIHNGDFIYLAIPETLVYLIMAFYTKSVLRIGFIVSFCSNIVWIVLRSAENYWIGHVILPEYRYDNDIYHLLLIVSTFILYKSFSYGYARPYAHM